MYFFPTTINSLPHYHRLAFGLSQRQVVPLGGVTGGGEARPAAGGEGEGGALPQNQSLLLTSRATRLTRFGAGALLLLIRASAVIRHFQSQPAL